MHAHSARTEQFSAPDTMATPFYYTKFTEERPANLFIVLSSVLPLRHFTSLSRYPRTRSHHHSPCSFHLHNHTLRPSLPTPGLSVVRTHHHGRNSRGSSPLARCLARHRVLRCSGAVARPVGLSATLVFERKLPPAVPPLSHRWPVAAASGHAAAPSPSPRRGEPWHAHRGQPQAPERKHPSPFSAPPGCHGAAAGISRPLCREFASWRLSDGCFRAFHLCFT